MTQDQINQAYQQMIAAGYTHEAVIAAIQAHIAAQTPAPVAAPVQEASVQAPVAQAVGGVMNAVGALTAIAAAAAEADDHSIIHSGFAPAQKGHCTVRLLGYIEVGVHAPSTPTHKNREMVHLIFEVNTPQHVITENGVSKPREVVVRSPKSHSGNAGFPRLFAALNAAHGDKYHHIGEMLGQAWCAEIFHSAPDANGRVWENFDKDKAWSFAPTSGYNRDGSIYNVTVPELYGKPMFFVFDNAGVSNPVMIKELWDSIYIDGVRESTKADGTKVETSKNYYQELLRASLTWSTSETFKALSTQVQPDTLTPIAPRRAKAAPQQGATQVPALGAAVAPVMPQVATQAAVPAQTHIAAPQPIMPQVAETAPVQQVAVQQPLQAPPAMVAPTQVAAAAPVTSPEVVAPSAAFTAPAMQPQQQVVMPAAEAPAAAPVQGDVNNFLAQFAV